MTSRPPPSTAERVSLIGSIAVVGLVVVLILTQLAGDDRPPAPVARVDSVREVGRAFHVDVEVHNGGDRTAAQVQVAADLTIGGETFTADQTIDFLSGGEEEGLTFVFARNPRSGDLRVVVSGFADP